MSSDDTSAPARSRPQVPLGELETEERSTPVSGIVTRGLVAGVIAAAAMAFWFLIVDGLEGIPFRTPAFLAASLLGMEEVRMTMGPILLYTLVHVALWAMVGVAVSWLVSVVKTASPVLLGLVLGFLLFDLAFYGSVVVTGVNVVEALGWPEVLVGNLIAGVALVGYLHWIGATRSVAWWVTWSHNRIVREGVVSGLIGAAVVAVWFLIIDFGRGIPFFTPGALGSAVFLGADSVDAVQITATTVIGYTFLHIVAFILTGFLAAAIVSAAEDTPPLLIGAGLFFVVFEAFFMGGLAILAEFLLGVLAWTTIALSNLLAAVGMGWYLWRKHPRLRAALAEDPLDKTD